MAFSAVNYNTNFGGINRAGTGNVYSLLNGAMQMDLIGIGCPAYILHNSSQKRLETLSFDVESIIFKNI